MHAICRIPSKNSNHQVLALLIKKTIKEMINKTTLIFPIIYEQRITSFLHHHSSFSLFMQSL